MAYTSTKLGSRTVRVALLAALAALTITLLPAAAEAHTLSMRKAKKLRNQTAIGLANALEGARVQRGDGVEGTLDVEDALVGRCQRRNAHTVRCLVGADGVTFFDDGSSERFICGANFTARYPSHRTRRVSTRVSGLGCGPDTSASSSGFLRKPAAEWKLLR